MKPIRLTGYARQQCLDRGASEAEVVQAVQQGTREPAKLDRELCRYNFAFGRTWQGRVQADQKFRLEPEGNTVCHTVSHRLRPFLADWLAEKIGA